MERYRSEILGTYKESSMTDGLYLLIAFFIGFILAIILSIASFQERISKGNMFEINQKIYTCSPREIR